MITNEQKQKYVEQLIEQFDINGNLLEALNWLIAEMDNVYEKRIQQRIDEEFKDFFYNIDNPPPPLKGKSIGKFKLVKIDEG